MAAVSSYSARHAALRAELRRLDVEGFVQPLTDEHLGEYIGEYARRLEWMTGFRGSAGSMAILPDRAAIFVDGRYSLQVRQEVDPEVWDYRPLNDASLLDWLVMHARRGSRIGYDPLLHSQAWTEKTSRGLRTHGLNLVAVEANPIDSIWHDRPSPPTSAMEVHAISFAGCKCTDKRAAISATLKSIGADAVVLSALDSIAWVLNIRGRDIPYTPVPRAYAIVNADATADLFIAPERIDEAIIAHLGDQVRIHHHDRFMIWLGEQQSRRIAVDPMRTPAAICQRLARGGATLVEIPDPCLLAKAIKNPVEIQGHRRAQLRDSAALIRFLKWLSGAIDTHEITELSAAEILKDFREQTGCLWGLSSATISAAGPNAAIPHYVPSPETDRPLSGQVLYMVDSGGQYRDGTTDVTRTLALKTPTREMGIRYTQVLKGHVALARTVFPRGTRGSHLDAFARQFLWADGVDYAHGTGHGVGTFLRIHEGPQRLSKETDDEPLQPGMLLTNEPGYYKAGEFGMRIENVVLVVEQPIPGAENEMLAFETLTLVPFDRALIEFSLLTREERAWIDAYHARVNAEVAPLLDADERDWLERTCRPLASGEPRTQALAHEC